MHSTTTVAFVIALSGLAASASMASDAPAPTPATASTPAAAPAPDAELDALAKLACGTYTDGARWLRIAPVTVTNAPRMLLAEIVLQGHEGTPDAHVLMQPVRRRGEPFLRLYRFPGGGTIGPGLWAAPEAFPDADASRLDLLTDLPIASDSKSAPTKFTAKTPNPIPTLTNGALEMTSDITVDTTGFGLVEHGFNSEGTQVWQFPEGKPGMYKRITETEKGLERRPSGLIVYILKEGAADAKVGQPLDEFKVHYTGWLPNGFLFDSSRPEGKQPLTITIPGGVIPGWNEGLIGMKIGEQRRLLVPPALGWGARGSQNLIPPNSWTIFDVELLELKKPETTPPAATPSPAPAPAQGAQPSGATPK